MANERQVKMTKRIIVRSINSDIRAFIVRPAGAGTVTLSIDDQESAKSIDDAPLVGGMLTRDDVIDLVRGLLDAAGIQGNPQAQGCTAYSLPASTKIAALARALPCPQDCPGCDACEVSHACVSSDRGPFCAVCGATLG